MYHPITVISPDITDFVVSIQVLPRSSKNRKKGSAKNHKKGACSNWAFLEVRQTCRQNPTSEVQESDQKAANR